MRSQSISSSTRVAIWPAAVLFLAGVIASASQAQELDLSNLDTHARTEEVANDGDLYLDVFVNGEHMQVIAVAREDEEGRLSMQASQLTEAGIRPEKAVTRQDGWIDLSTLPQVSVEYDRTTQALRFQAADTARVARKVSAKSGIDPMDESDPRNEVRSGSGALLNYTLNASSSYGFEKSDFSYGGISGTFEGRLFSPAGSLANSMSLSDGDWRRLDSSWSYSDPGDMITYKAGDLITGGMSWTQPVRLVGAQVQRNFGLRPGLVTLPIPGFRGSAAVPSTVEVFLNNTRRFSQNIGSGPFEVTDMPVITGSGDAKVVVRDENGNETVTESAFFVSDRMLRPELMDFSLEVGFPRTGYGTSDDRYDDKLFASASMRYGLSDRLTLEAHAEGGEELANGGVALISGLGRWGVGSLSLAGSRSGGDDGLQAGAAVEMELGRVHIQASVQQTFGDYHDIASVSRRDIEDDEDDYFSFLSERTRSRQQITLSFPAFDNDIVNLGYTRLERISGERDQLITASYSRPIFGGSFSLSGFSNTETGDTAVLASLSLPIGAGMTASTSLQSDGDGLSSYSTLTRSAKPENGNVGFQLQYQQDDQSRLVATTDVKTPIAEVRSSLSQYDDTTYGRIRARGAVVATDGSLFLANRIDDAFAVVDAGAADVTVLSENKPVGKTGRNGKLIVSDLRSYERNNLGVDPTSLPLDVTTSSTSQTVVPAANTGVPVRFVEKSAGGRALVTFRDEHNAFIEAGSSVIEGVAAAPVIVGYDGQAFLTGLKAKNRVTIALPFGKRCVASFAFTPQKGALVSITDIPCISR